MMDYRAGAPSRRRWYAIGGLLFGALAWCGPARSQAYNQIGVSLFDISNTAQTVKGSAGTFVGFECYNPNATAASAQFYNSLAAVVGTTTPMASVRVPALTSTGPQPASLAAQYANGVPFTAGLQVSATSGATGAVAPTLPLACTLTYR